MIATALGRFRFRWTRIAFLAVGIYVGVGVVTSAHHWWVLDQQAHQLSSQLAAVHHNTVILTNDLRQLHNPVALRRMLAGKAPLPNAICPTP